MTASPPTAVDEAAGYDAEGIVRPGSRQGPPHKPVKPLVRLRVAPRLLEDVRGFGCGRVGIEGEEAGPKPDFGWEVWPNALYDMLMRITRDYGTPVLEVTENGCAYGDAPSDRGVVNDTRRIDFYRGYIEAVHRAIQDGADVRGYHAWSLLDNFEWAEGYGQRFGLTWVDFETGERTLKESGRWYGQVAAENGFSS